MAVRPHHAVKTDSAAGMPGNGHRVLGERASPARELSVLVGRSHVLQRAVEPQAIYVFAEPLKRRGAERWPGRMHSCDGCRKIVSSCAGHHEAVRPLHDELSCGVVFATDKNYRGPLRERLDHDEAVALPPRGENEAERTRE